MSTLATSYPARGAVKIEWTGLTQDDEGSPCTAIRYRDKSVGVFGTFDTATVTIEGSMNGSDWVTLKNPLGDPLTFSSEGIEAILENPLFIRPVVDDSGTSADLTVVLAGNA